MDHLKNVFAQCKQEGRPALVTYVTAGFPTAEETPDIMLGMQAGGAGESLSHWRSIPPRRHEILTNCARYYRTRPAIH